MDEYGKDVKGVEQKGAEPNCYRIYTRTRIRFQQTTRVGKSGSNRTAFIHKESAIFQFKVRIEW